MIYPYPDENSWWNEFGDAVVATYKEANSDLDIGSYKWWSRTGYDIAWGLSPEQSKFKHINELRGALGLPLIPDPQIILPKLVPFKQYFKLDTGERFTTIEATDFQLLQRLLNKIDIEPVLQQRQDCGFNMVRVLGMCNGMFHLYPQEHSDYFDVLMELYNRCANHYLHVELTVFADATIVMPDPNAQIVHWGKFDSINSGLVELVNEADQTINKLVSINQLQPFPNVPCSHGSNGSQAQPVSPYWDYVTFHTNGASEEQRKVGHNAMEIWDGPSLTNETSRFNDVGMWMGADLNRIKQLAYDSAAGASLLCAGSCFHSIHGKSSELWDSNELEAAKSWSAGAKSVDLQYQDGEYHHGQEEMDYEIEHNLLRAYRRGDSPYVEIRK